jgi:hypothetical protein
MANIPASGLHPFPFLELPSHRLPFRNLIRKPLFKLLDELSQTRNLAFKLLILLSE